MIFRGVYRVDMLPRWVRTCLCVVLWHGWETESWECIWSWICAWWVRGWGAIWQWSYGVMVSTLDSESSDPGSNPGRTSLYTTFLLLFVATIPRNTQKPCIFTPHTTRTRPLKQPLKLNAPFHGRFGAWHIQFEVIWAWSTTGRCIRLAWTGLKG